MDLATTRKLVDAALSGSLDEVPVEPDPIFGLGIPREVPGVPLEVLEPWRSWTERSYYEEVARTLAAKFQKNFEAFVAAGVDAAVAAAGPRCG
jgi:phosphoenolpyruvate carboxykinase (ATP)